MFAAIQINKEGFLTKLYLKENGYWCVLAIFYSMCPPSTATTDSTRLQNAHMDLLTSAASILLAAALMLDFRASTELWWTAQASLSSFPYR